MTVAAAVLLTGIMPARAYLPGDGRGKPEVDCLIGLEGYDEGDLSPFGKRGRPSIQCTDCDPACDLDGVPEPNGSCGFSIAVRVNDPDVEGCTPSPLRKVKAKAKTKGTRIDVADTFQPPLDGSSAISAFVDFPVLVRKFGRPKPKPGKGKVVLLAKTPKDKDKIVFVCNPLPEGATCPEAATTTTTTSSPTTTTSTTNPPLCLWTVEGDFESGDDFSVFALAGDVLWAWLEGTPNSLTLSVSGPCAGELCVYRVGDASPGSIEEAQMRGVSNDVSGLEPLSCGPVPRSESFPTDSSYVFVVTSVPSATSTVP